MSFFHRWLGKKFTQPTVGLSPHARRSVAHVIDRALTAAGLLKSTRDKRRDVRADPSDETVATEAADRRNDALDREARTGREGVGEFLSASSETGLNKLDYKLYVPSSYADGIAPVALIVMLHGCTQDPDDFAAGTEMNVLAEKEGFLVAYPKQSAHANTAKCWNWFRPDDQRRDHGEPKQIAELTRQIIGKYRIDPQRVYVAGLSAGAAMAVIMGRTYPDLFRAVGAHSGLAYRSASNVISALSVMKAAKATTAGTQKRAATPMIIFHGDSDRTVDESNSAALAKQTIEDWPEDETLLPDPVQTVTDNGRAAERHVYRRSDGRPVIELWRIGGAGHFWSGGNPRGSHTDAKGPKATERFVRFFKESG